MLNDDWNEITPFENVEGDVTGDTEYALASWKKLDNIEDLLADLREHATAPIYRDDEADLLVKYACAISAACELRARLQTLIDEVNVAFRVARS